MITHDNTLLSCITSDQLESLRKCERISLHANLIEQGYEELKKKMMTTSDQTQYVFKIFGLNTTATFFIAMRNIMRDAFGLEVKRQSSRSDRAAHKTIYIDPKAYKTMLTMYAPEVLQLAETLHIDKDDVISVAVTQQ